MHLHPPQPPFMLNWGASRPSVPLQIPWYTTDLWWLASWEHLRLGHSPSSGSPLTAGSHAPDLGTQAAMLRTGELQADFARSCQGSHTVFGDLQ